MTKAATNAPPPELTQALTASPELAAAWDSLTPIGRRDFIAWIESAKQEETRLKRVAVACDKLARGERRPCCYSIMPLDFHLALKAAPDAKAQWSGLTPDERRDYLDWIESATDKAARSNRIEQACTMLAAGERRSCGRGAGS